MASAPFSKNNYDNIYNLTFALLNKQLNSLKYLRDDATCRASPWRGRYIPR